MSMSHKLNVLDLERGGEISLTQQLVDRVAALIDSGELEPGEKLPATRALAEDAGINHLTAVRVYRRLAELGYVTAAVGRGTFVRQHRPAPAARENDDWQLPMLAPRPMSYADDMLHDLLGVGEGSEAVIPLASGFPDPALCPSQELADAAAQLTSANPRIVSDYLSVEGLPALRERLAELGLEGGFARSADEILVTTGARQAIDLVTRALLGPGDVAVVESPTFAGTLASLQASGARVLPVPVDADGIDVDALEQILARHEIKLVATQSACQNPTGADLSPGRRERLLELARTRGFFVMEDGVYSKMRYEGSELVPMRATAPSHVIYVDSMSKTIGGGLRVGWLAASGPVMDRLVRLKLDSDMHTSALPQYLAAWHLEGDRHAELLARAVPVYRRRRDALLRALDRHLGDGAAWNVPTGGHHVWVTLHESVDERALYAEALRAGMTFMPGGAVQAEKSSRTSLRLSFSLASPEALDEAARRLAVALREVRRRGRTSVTGAMS
jgi:2-aminoadipate transaminase